MALLVVEPGMQSTIQDLGRFGMGILGVSAAGTADSVSLRIGNRLVGNQDGAPAIEMTLRGASFRTDAPAIVAVSGSDFGASIPLWTAAEIPAGGMITTGATRSGARCLLCVRGGVRVPPVLGSASTHLGSRIGGYEGRALKTGDKIEVGPDPGRWVRKLRVRSHVIEDIIFRRTLRVTVGPQADWFSPESIDRFHREWFEVSEEADRMGLRLRGPSLARARSGDLVTEGVSLGAVQVPDGGAPIILFVDQQTTGGYPKIANVITADLAAVGQLRPRNQLRFEAVSLDEARRLLAQQEARLEAVLEDA
jgi:biotin-dependent carboxylase-like uncharacterized protein